MSAKQEPIASSYAIRAQSLLDRIDYRRANNAKDLDALVHLRYKAYLKEGAIEKSASERLEDKFDDLDNVYNIGVFIDGHLASALRLHILKGADAYSPAVETFGEVLRPLLAEGKTIIDPNRFVADCDIAHQYPELPYLTLRLANLAATRFSADYVTMTVRAEHQAFYKRGFFARVACPPRPYPLLSKPISLLLVDYVADRGRIEARHPYWKSSEEERERLLSRAFAMP
jgi:N-acyl-L-homoserine lactone synthetase